MFATAVRSQRDLGVLSVSLNVLTGHRSLPRRIAAGAQDQTAAGAGAGLRMPFRRVFDYTFWRLGFK
jgi:hypothetical protein